MVLPVLVPSSPNLMVYPGVVQYRYGAAKNTGTIYGTVNSVRYILYGRTRFTDNLENFGEVPEPSVSPLLRSASIAAARGHTDEALDSVLSLSLSL
eukprot:SAG11_NODE_1492_length_4807_cov_2.686703_1_plen_95_part_10